MGSDDVIIPGTANLSFITELSSMADPKGALVSNIGRAIVKKLAVKLKEMRYCMGMILTCSHTTKTYGRQSQESRMQ